MKITDIDLRVPASLEFVKPYVEAAIKPLEGAATPVIVLRSLDPRCAGDDGPVPDGAVVLKLPTVIGTGMTGFGQHLARSIWRGTFFHFPGNEMRLSVVHAVDVGRAVALLCTRPPHEGAEYTLTDGVDPTLHDLAEAIAYRLRNKRISNLSTRPQQWMGRIAYGRRRYEEYTTSRCVDGSAFVADYPEFVPTDVCTYLRTHVYDDSSL